MVKKFDSDFVEVAVEVVSGFNAIRFPFEETRASKDAFDRDQSVTNRRRNSIDHCFFVPQI